MAVLNNSNTLVSVVSTNGNYKVSEKSWLAETLYATIIIWHCEVFKRVKQWMWEMKLTIV